MLLPEPRIKLVAGNALEIGSLQDLRAAGKGGLDPNGDALSCSVLWACLPAVLAACFPECCAALVSQIGNCSRSTSAFIYALHNEKHQQTALHISQSES